MNTHPLWPAFEKWADANVVAGKTHTELLWDAFLAGAQASRQYESEQDRKIRQFVQKKEEKCGALMQDGSHCGLPINHPGACS